MTERNAGIDISEDRLDAFSAPDARTGRFSNDAAGFKELIEWMGTDIGCVAYEPTGPWHREFEEALQEAGVPLKRVNPYQVRCFAKGLGKRAKTDPIDAKVLAHGANGGRVAPDPGQLPGTARSRRTPDRTGRAGRRPDRHPEPRQAPPPCGSQPPEQRPAPADRAAAQPDRRRERGAARRRRLPRPQDRLPHLDPRRRKTTAAGLIARMPELGELNRSTAASLAGLAPMTRESGLWKGHSFISGGRHRVRRMLYMPALAAIRFNPDMKKTYRISKTRANPPRSPSRP